ncbi:MAG: hypothetical protein KGJ58_00545 [Patescibacteria group bacterium]|nr:hypothetical protein [Patescibacteria group bacterium]MDE2217931.1 hypothetical protein [Patescibacteria group bacterium]
MTLIYILLTIIAIGVLLLSEEGKSILRSIWIIPVIAGVGFVGFYLIIGGIAFFRTDSFKWFYENLLPWIFIGLLISYGIYWISKNFKKIIKIFKTLGQNAWVKRDKGSIFLIILLLTIISSWVTALILASQ